MAGQPDSAAEPAGWDDDPGAP